MSKKQKQVYAILCEGDTKYEFIMLIKTILFSKKKVKVFNNRGGSYKNMTDRKANLLQNKEYKEVYIVTDSDHIIEQIDDPTVILAEPCFEGELLKILNVKISGMDSKKCKKKFQSEFLTPRDKQKDQVTRKVKIADYKNYFQKRSILEVLDLNKNKSPWLNKIIKIFE